MKVTITVPGDGRLLAPIWRALEAQAAFYDDWPYGGSEECAALNFVARQLREVYSPMGIIGGTWEEIWQSRGDL